MEKQKLKRDEEWDSNSLGNYTSVENIQKQLRKNNWAYIRRHPELRAIVRVLLHELINKKPDNLYEFGAALFNCNNTPLLVTKINKQLNHINDQLKKGQWSEFDGDFLFNENDSSHSLISTNSMYKDIDRMLRFAMILRDKEE